MPTFDITLDVYVFLLIIVLSAILGFLTRSRQLAKKQRKIVELECEMMQAHAELLENQREYCELERRIKDRPGTAAANPANPVIAMKGKTRPTGTD
jgi:hypothetical protein